MGIMEIVLIVLGVIVFVGSFLIPAGRGDDTQAGSQISEDIIRGMVEKEVEDAKLQLGDIVDETITYAMEKTERSMDRLTNEKMMAVNEYSDTVLEEINKNHKEAVFLYDMLNDKHENLKSTVSEAVKTATEVKQTVKDAEIRAKEVESSVVEAGESIGAGTVPAAAPAPEMEFTPFVPEKVEVVRPAQEPKRVEMPIMAQSVERPEGRNLSGIQMSQVIPKQPEEAGTKDTEAPAFSDAQDVEVTLDADGKRNSNERILELHKIGKSNMAIAKELGLGIGEVKLVIDLFEGL